MCQQFPNRRIIVPRRQFQIPVERIVDADLPIKNCLLDECCGKCLCQGADLIGVKLVGKLLAVAAVYGIGRCSVLDEADRDDGIGIVMRCVDKRLAE